MKVLLHREVRVRLRSKIAFKANMARTLILGLVFGLTFFRVESRQTTVFMLNGALFFAVLMGFFNSALSIVMTLPKQMPTLLREHSAGNYSISALYLAKTLSDLPIELLFSVVWSLLMYWMIGFRDEVGNFVVFTLLVFLGSLTALGIGYFAGMTAAQPQFAFLLVLLNILPAMLFGGFFINLASIPAGCLWLKTISVVRYMFSLILINQWGSFGPLPCTADDQAAIGGCPYPDGDAVLASLDIDEDDWGSCLLAVLVIAVFYRLLALLMLLRRARPVGFEGAMPDDGTQAAIPAAVLVVEKEEAAGAAQSKDSGPAEEQETEGRCGASSTRGQRLKLSLRWHDVTVTVPEVGGAKPMKQILHSVSGSAQPGQLTAVMGPSGSGKTTLLQILAAQGALPYSGRVTANGSSLTAAHGRVFAFMFQEDLFPADLTVREHLLFQTELRLPESMPLPEKSARVDAVVAELGLGSCEGTLIGAISGGERKRLSFAAAILTDPAILFADEPTSGLDSAMAESVVRSLRRLALGNPDTGVPPRTVIATVHQPSRAIFDRFDALTLMHDGHMAFCGRAVDAMSHFASKGMACPADCNPPDHFLRILVNFKPPKLYSSTQSVPT